MAKPRVAIIGAGLCGSVLAARLRTACDVTVIEQSRKPRPLLDEIACTSGGINSSINRAAGLGGTTNYWHNALIELDDDELRDCGLEPSRFAPHYRRAWSLFLSDRDVAAARVIRDANASALIGAKCTAAHMVVPHARVSAWAHADRAYPGDPVKVIYGHAERLVMGGSGAPESLQVATERGPVTVEADRYVVCAGGLATPVLLAASLGETAALCGGYHDHPMAYVAKLRLRPDSTLKQISCHDTGFASIRTGFVYEVRGVKAVFYLRPALSLGLKSITGEARYVLSDLRNDPFSPKKILQLLTNIEALREAVLFKTKAGFRGDFYSVLMLGEQTPADTRGIRVSASGRPSLNWEVTSEEHAAYQQCFEAFVADMSSHIVDRNMIPGTQWDYRTAAHHSGAARNFLDGSTLDDSGFFAAAGASNVSVCDASLLRRGGIANSGLTLVALCHMLADALVEQQG